MICAQRNSSLASVEFIKEITCSLLNILHFHWMYSVFYCNECALTIFKKSEKSMKIKTIKLKIFTINTYIHIKNISIKGITWNISPDHTNIMDTNEV